MFVNDYAYVIIGGSTKCATTSLFSYLADHPNISGSKIKESRFFWTGDYPLKREALNIDSGIESYNKLFIDKPNSRYRLEATPDYLYSKLTADLIHRNLNNVRFIFIVRDPIDRIISWFKFARQLNLISADLSIDDFIINQFNQSENIRQQHLLALEQGRYGLYLNNYIKEFGKEAVKVLRYEDISQQPLKTMKDICLFLNIDFSHYDSYDFKILNQSVNVNNVDSFNKYRDVRRFFRRGFKKFLPGELKNTFKVVFKKIDNIYLKNATTDFEEIKISNKILDKLNDYYAADRLLVESIVNN